jgi:hexosaminidase
MTPGNFCYFDHYQAGPEDEPIAIGGMTTLKEVYNYEPVPEELNKKEAKHILGAQGNVWTEYMQTPEKVEYMVLPRMAALSEVVWTMPKQKNWNSFQRRVANHFKRYEAFGWNYCPGTFKLTFSEKKDDVNGGYQVTIASEIYQPEIHYTLDGTDPLVTSPVYDDVLQLMPTAELKAVIFEDGKPKGSIATHVVGKDAK